ncbi:beta-lactamase [Filimonas lacunae]|nr:beta-lactamase [Filimonas lacunae]
MLSIAVNGYTQQTRQHIDSLQQILKQAYNQQQPEALDALMQVIQQPAPPKEVVAQQLQNVYKQLGNWQKASYMYQLNQVYFYTVTFEKQQVLLTLLTDSLGKIRYYTFKPIYSNQLHKTEKVRSNNSLTSALDKKVDSLVAPYIQLQNTAGICIAIIDKNTVATYSYGETKKGNKQLPDPATTLFEIGSNTKTFTGLLLAAGIVNKEVEPDEDIERFLPDSITNLAYQGTPITLLTLANHTSSLPRIPGNLFTLKTDTSTPYNHYDSSLLLAYLKQFHPAYKPGTTFAYSNLGMGLLGQLLAWHHHTTYEALLTQTILQPLHLNHTKLTLTAEDSSKHAQGYNERNEPNALWNMQSLNAAGGLHSTVTDMARYIQANLGKAPASLLPAIQLAQHRTFTDGVNQVGLAWMIQQLNGHDIFIHDGATFGFKSFIAFDKESEKGVVILTNCAENITLLGYQFMQ